MLQVIVPGPAFASAISSAMVFTLRSLFATTATVTKNRRAIGRRLFPDQTTDS